MSALAALAVLVLAVPALGHAALAAAGTPEATGGMAPGQRRFLPWGHRLPPLLERLALDTLAGLVLVFVVLLTMDLAGLPWRRGVLAAVGAVAGGALAALVWWRRRRSGPGQTVDTAVPLGWGDGMSALVLAAFAAAAWTRRITIPDFVYHWGVKGKKYWIEGGIDFGFLADPLGLTDHPDYPNLLPSLYAVTTEMLGRFRERPVLAWSALFMVLIALTARRALEVGTGPECRGGLVDRGTLVRGGTLAVTLVATPFAVAHHLAGGGDLLMALALVAALPGLLGERDEAPGEVAAGDLRVGLAAALAAGAKIEGVPLALLLVAVRAWKVAGVPSWRALHRDAAALARRLPRLALPPLLVTGPWFVQCVRHGLFRTTNTGDFEPGRWGEIGPAVWRVMNMDDWHHLPWLLVLLPPLLLLRRLRPAVLVLHLQAAFYLFVYLTAPVDTGFYVLSSLPRLLYHLLVPGVVLLILAVATKQR